MSVAEQIANHLRNLELRVMKGNKDLKKIETTANPNGTVTLPDGRVLYPGQHAKPYPNGDGYMIVTDCFADKAFVQY